MATRASIQATLVGFDTVPGPFTGGASCTVTKKVNLTEGNGDNQYEAILCFKQQLALSTTIPIDFGTDDDVYGDVLAATDVVAGFVANNGPVGAAGVLHVEPNVADPWVSWLSATGATDRGRVIIPENSGVLFWGLKKGSYPVAGGNDRLDIIESGGAFPVDLEATFMIRR